MKFFNHKKSVIFVIIISIAIFLLNINFTWAQNPDDLIVVFSPNPLFNAVNFVPGQYVSGWVEVKNNSGITKTIITEAINVNDLAKFGDVLDFEIKENVTALYGPGKTLTNFFVDDEVILSNLANGVTTTYEFVITFPSSAGNDYQGKILNNFDILIGFLGEEGGQVVKGVQGVSGGGGGSASGLTIAGETVKVVKVEETQVTITWLTSYFSTSQVIYAVEGEAHNLDLTDNIGSPSKYGYTSAKEGDDSGLEKVTAHSVTLTGLIPGTKYYFRVVSHASPPTISQEFTFTTLGLPPKVLEEEIGLGGPEQEGIGEIEEEEAGLLAGPVIPLPAAAGEIEAEVAGEQVEAEIPEEKAEVAGAEEKCQSWPWRKATGWPRHFTWWLWLIIIIGYFIFLIFYYFLIRRHSRTVSSAIGYQLKKRLWIIPLLVAIIIVLVYLKYGMC